MISEDSDEWGQMQQIQNYIGLYYDDPERVRHNAQETGGRFSLSHGRYSTEPEDDEIVFIAPGQGLLGSWVINRHLEPTFSERLREMMKERSLSAPEVYKRGNLDRSLFSKLMTDPAYSPSKDTAIQVAFGLQLSLKEAKELIGSAGYQLSRSIRRDVALECCFKHGYNNVVQ